jgi:hypothetical protein
MTMLKRTTDFYLNLDRWESIAMIERARGRWESRRESAGPRLGPILRETAFLAAYALSHPGTEPNEKIRKKVLAPIAPLPLPGTDTQETPLLRAWRYARAVHFVHGWYPAFSWNEPGFSQVERVLNHPGPADFQPPRAPRLIELRRRAALATDGTGGVDLIEIGAFISGLQEMAHDDDDDIRLNLLALRVLILQKGYVQALFAPLEKEWAAMSVKPSAEGEPHGIWLDQATALLSALGRMADEAWERMRVAAQRSGLQEQIIAFAQRNGKVTAGDVIMTTGANRNTIKDNLARLVDEGILLKKGIKRGTIYLMN